MPPAARITDMHVCPMVNPGPVPHVGGPTTSGEATVIIGFQPAARVGDSLLCTGPGVSDSISQGEPTVIIGNMPAARLGDPTSHGGVLVAGCPTVIIGSSTQAFTITVAAQAGVPFCEECERKKKAAASNNAVASTSSTPEPEPEGPPPSSGGPYSHLQDPADVGPSKDFTPEQKAKVIEENMKRNGGVVRSDVSGKVLTKPAKSKKGITPDPNEWQLDHIIPKSKGGTNSYSNIQVLSRQENRTKWDS